MFEGLTPEEVKAIEAELAKLPPQQQDSARQRLASMRPEELKAMFKKVGPVCVFCKIAAKEIPARMIYEDADVLAFLDINPANIGHILVTPKRHTEFFTDLRDEEAKKIIVAMKNLANTVVKVVGAEGFNILQSNGKIAGQEVPHVHFHIIPRFSGDGHSFAWSHKKFSDEEFAKIQAEIVKNLTSGKKSAPKAKKKRELEKIKPRIPKY